jgi:carboxypeptidase Q
MMRNIYNDPNDDIYFKYHHSAGDTMNILNPDELDSNVFAISSMMYIIADYPERLPKAF